MSTTEASTTERPPGVGRRGGPRPIPTRGWIALGALLGVYAVGAVSRLDPVLLASLLPGGS